MKLKIKRVKYPSGTWYYDIYQKVFFFFWYRRVGCFDTLEEAEKNAVRILEQEKEERKYKKENPVYYELVGDVIVKKP